MQLDPLHFLSCQYLKEEGTKKRHDPLCMKVRDWVRKLGGACRLEPRYSEKAEKKRPDGEVYIRNKELWFDVSVIHPLAKSHVKEAAKGSLVAAAKREREKTNKHGPAAAAHRRQNPPRFFPLVLETSGGFGASVSLFLEEYLSLSKDMHHIWAPTGIAFSIWRELAVTLAKGNWDVMHAGLKKVSANA